MTKKRGARDTVAVLYQRTAAHSVVIKIENDGDAASVQASVTDFANVIGYCEHKLAPIAEGVVVEPPAAVVRGGAAHRLEEVRDAEAVAERIELGELVEATEEAIADPTIEVQLERESVRTTLEETLSIDGKSATLRLLGRADKVCRIGGALRVIDNKFVANPSKYDTRDEPFFDQKLQVLAYLNSEFSTGPGKSDALEIPHESKEWSVQIHNSKTREPAKTFLRQQSERDVMTLGNSMERFTALALGWMEPNGPTSQFKCRPCQYVDMCKFAYGGSPPPKG